MAMDKRPGDENTLRISNLPQHTEEDDLKALIMEKMREVNPTTASPQAIRRLFLARNKLTREVCSPPSRVTVFAVPWLRVRDVRPRIGRRADVGGVESLHVRALRPAGRVESAENQLNDDLHTVTVCHAYCTLLLVDVK